MDTLGLYLHIPFCKKKCSYCDFYSVTNVKLIDNYVDELCREIDLRSAAIKENIRENIEDNSKKKSASDGLILPLVDTIYLGGGTPSLLNPQQLSQIVTKIKENFTLASDVEFTMECNPGARDEKYFPEYNALGVNRLSIGVQSFSDDELKFLDRIHTAQDAENTIEKAVATFGNVSVDLIFAVPNQTWRSLESSLTKAISLGVNHISCYALIFEENTPLFEEMLLGKVKETGDDASADLYLNMCDFLISRDFEQYEISNFARSNRHSRHNLKYWLDSDVLAFGTSAVGFYRGNRYKNYPDILKYKAALNNHNLPEAESEFPEKKELLTETIFLSLRSIGIDFDLISRKFNVDARVILAKEIEHLVKENYARSDGYFLKLTPKGYFICDEITLRILRIFEENDYV